MAKLLPTGDQQLVRSHNTALLLNELRRRGSLSRAQLAAIVNLNRSTASSIVNEQIEAKMIRETTLVTGQNGRPGMLLELNPQGGCMVGVDISVDYISVVLTDFVANKLWSKRIASPPKPSEAQAAKLTEPLVQKALSVGTQQGLRPLGIGLCMPGLVDTQAGTLVFAPYLDWYNVCWREHWQQLFGVPVYVENDSRAAALAEYYFGVAQNRENTVYLGTAVGLSAGILTQGQLFHGCDGFAGQVGHMMVDPKGERCGCGRRGCWESKVSPHTIVEQVHQSLKKGHKSTLLTSSSSALEFEDIVNAARQGDRVALDVFAQVGQWLGVGIANILNIFNPELVVLGGTLSLAGDLLIEQAQKTAQHEALRHPGQAVQIVASAYGDDAAVIGGVSLVFDHIMKEPVLLRDLAAAQA